MKFFQTALCVMLLTGLTSALASELVLIPAPSLESVWLRMSYSNIQPTDYKFSGGKLTIRVDKSAAPFLYPFEKPAKLKSVFLKGSLLERPNMKQGKDDFILRVGPALEGQRRLNTLQRLLAPKWIIELNDLARASERKLGGLNLALIALKSTAPSWKQRQHPDADIITENIALEIAETGPFELNLAYPENLPPSLGLWISSDGDNSGTQFSLRIDELRLQFYDGDK